MESHHQCNVFRAAPHEKVLIIEEEQAAVDLVLRDGYFHPVQLGAAFDLILVLGNTHAEKRHQGVHHDAGRLQVLGSETFFIPDKIDEAAFGNFIEQFAQFGMQVIYHEHLGVFGEVVFLMMDDILPDAAERGISVQVFGNLRGMHLAQQWDQQLVGLAVAFRINELAEFELFHFP